MRADIKTLLAEAIWVKGFASSALPTTAAMLVTARNGHIRLTCTDLTVAGISSVAADGNDNWNALIQPGQFVKFLKSLGNGEVTLEPEGSSLRVTRGKTTATLLGGDPATFPEIPEIAETCTLSGLLTALPRTTIAISPEESRFTLNGALLDTSEAVKVLVSTDGHRLSVTPVVFDGPPLKTLIRRDVLSALQKMRVESVAFGIDGDYQSFSAGIRRIVGRKLDGSFPDYVRIIPTSFKGYCRFTTADLLAAMRTVETFTDERTHATLFHMERSELTISAQHEGSASSSFAATMLGDVETFDVYLNAEYISEAVALAGDSAVLGFNAYDKPACLIASDGWTHILMPIRMVPPSIEDEDN